MAATNGHVDEAALRCRAREAVAVFGDYDDLVAAIEELELAGFDRAQINLAPSWKRMERTLGHRVADVRELEGEAQVPPGNWVDRHELAEGKAALTAGLAYIGSFAAIGVTVATGGELAMVVAAAAAAGGAGGALGAWLAHAIDRRWAHRIEEQLLRGGLPLWVETHGPGQERAAILILEHHAARDVHLHDPRHSREAGQAPFRGRQPGPPLSS